MKKFLTLIFLLAAIMSFGQDVFNPYTGAIDWTPNSGADGVQGTYDCGQSIVADFNFGVSGVVDVQPTGDLTFTVGIAGLEWGSTVAGDVISGPFSEYFSYSFLDPMTLLATQIGVIPATGNDPVNLIQGNIEVDVKVPDDAVTGETFVININIQTSLNGNVQADDNESTNGDVQCNKAEIRGVVTVTNREDMGPDSTFTGVQIILLDENNNPLDTTLTDENGAYAFTNLAAGNYVVIQTQPANFTSVSDRDETPELTPPGNFDFSDFLDSQAGFPVNDTIPVNLIDDEIDADNDFVEEPAVQLPVEFLFFKVKAIESDAYVSWATASEINASHFEVERSSDGRSFEMFDRVEAIGNSSRVENYASTDANLKAGKYYYRLKQVDLDGSYTYTEIRTVDIEGNMSIDVFPNPTTEFIQIDYDSELGVESFELIDNAGKLVRQLDKAQGTHDISDLPNGTYFIRVKTSLGATMKRIIKIQ